MSNAPTDSRQAAPALRAVAQAAAAPGPAAPAQPVPAQPAAAKPGPQPVPLQGPKPVPQPVAKPAPQPGPKPVAKPAARPVAARPGTQRGALPARFRFRHYMAAASFLVVVVLPFLATTWYLFTRAADQYHSETAFSVRSEEIGGSAAGILGALTQVGGGSASDTDVLFDYLRSQEMVAAVDKRLDLRRIYNRPLARPGPHDFFFTLGDDPSIEALTAEWNRMVTVDFESHAGILHIRANAFTPEDATAIARAIIDESTALVNRLSDQARADAVRFSSEELARIEEDLRVQRARLADFRRQNRLVDPSADVASQMGLLNALQGELAKAMVERDQLLSFVGKDDQRVIQADRRIDAIQKRMEAERGTLGAGEDGPGPDGAPKAGALADVVGSYEELKVDLEFANAAYTQAMAAHAAARAEARRQTRYLAAHVMPTTADQSLYPRRPLLAGLTLLFLMLGWGIMMLVYYNIRDSR